MPKILVIHGPNLNLLGSREVDIYGKVTMEEINSALARSAKKYPVEIKTMQSNHEGEIIELIGKAKSDKIDGILMNPAAYTHTSVAIRDAVAASGLPVVEVHLSNIYSREEFRKTSLIAPVARGQVSGFGMQSYILGLEGLMGILRDEK